MTKILKKFSAPARLASSARRTDKKKEKVTYREEWCEALSFRLCFMTPFGQIFRFDADM